MFWKRFVWNIVWLCPCQEGLASVYIHNSWRQSRRHGSPMSRCSKRRCADADENLLPGIYGTLVMMVAASQMSNYEDAMFIAAI